MFTTYMPAFVASTTAIPVDYLNRINVDVARAIDGVGGGRYSPYVEIDILGSGIGSANLATLLDVRLGGQTVDPVGANIVDVTDQTFALSGGQIREFAAPAGLRNHDLSNTGATAGSWIHFTVPTAGAGNIVIRRSGFAGNDIVTILGGGGVFTCATVYFDGTNWRLLGHRGGTPGPDA